MSPPPSKDWWLAAALTGAALPAATLAQQPPRPDGVITTVPSAGAAQPGSRHAPLMINQANGQRIVTDGKTSVHILFPDQSAMTVGPNSEVVLQNYQYDPQTKDGSFVVNMTKGVLRVVGGFITKKNSAQVITPTATVGIRGGISFVQILEGPQGQTLAAFLFGVQMSFTQPGFPPMFLNRPGFAFMTGLPEAFRLQIEQLRQLLSLLGENALTSQGPPPPPPPAPAPGTDDELNNIDPNRVQGTTGFGEQGPPNLNQLLGSPGPGNQS